VSLTTNKPQTAPFRCSAARAEYRLRDRDMALFWDLTL
jgi:hypothetical protein